MKNLFTLLLLVISLLAFGQSNSQSIEVEIKYWKSIAESNDTVAYREYLQRYGEDGLYKDEALTRIALLKTSRKQVQPKSIECCFYYIPYEGYHTVVRFNDNQDTVWLKSTYFDTIRSNLAASRDFYEDQAVLSKSRELLDIQHFSMASGSYEYSPDHYKYKYAWTTDEEYQYNPMKSTAARDVYFKQDELFLIEREYCVIGRPVTPYPSFYKYSDDVFFEINYDVTKKVNAWFCSVKESEREHGQPYFLFKIKKIMKGYRYIAISKDKSSIIMWFEEDDNLDGVILEKREYKRKPKEELLPKAVNYDFLNE